MANRMDFFKKWTPVLPGAAHISDPFEVTAYKTVLVQAYVAGFIAPGPLALQPEGSLDLGAWDPIGGPININAAGAWGTATLTDPPPFIRMVATTAGGQMTCHAVGVGREN